MRGVAGTFRRSGAEHNLSSRAISGRESRDSLEHGHEFPCRAARLAPRLAWDPGPTTEVGPVQPLRSVTGGKSGDFSAIETNFRDSRDAPPCATLCTVMLHVSDCARRLFRDHHDSVSLSAKTVTHWADFSGFLGRKVTQECAMWRIISGRRFRARHVFSDFPVRHHHLTARIARPLRGHPAPNHPGSGEGPPPFSSRKAPPP